MSTLKSPPTFDTEGDNYGNQKKDIQVWQVLVGNNKKKQAVVYLLLQGTACDAARSIDACLKYRA